MSQFKDSFLARKFRTPRLLPLLLLLLLLLLQLLPAHSEAELSSWIDYTPGDCNLLISAPHGGSLRPSQISPRTYGCVLDGQCSWVKDCQPTSLICRAATGADVYTLELASALVSELSTTYGCVPHFVRSNLHRSRLDPNREIEEAAQGDELAEEAWRRYHTQYMASAVASIKAQFGKGLVVDIHGQAHAEQWTEIGTLLTKDDLNTDNLRPELSSVRGLLSRSEQSADDLLRGPGSFGGLLSSAGYKVVPSPQYPKPGQGGFYSGGFITRNYGSLNGGLVDAIQVEVNSDIRRNGTARAKFVTDLAGVVHQFRLRHYG